MPDKPGPGTHASDAIVCCFLIVLTVLLFPVKSAAFDLSTTDDFPYALSPAVESALLPAGIAVISLGGLLELGASPPNEKEVMALDERDIPAVDRSAIQYYSATANTISDVGLITMEVAPALLALSQLPRLRHRWRNILTLGAMYGEVVLLTGGATQIAKILAARPRPFVYNDDVPMADKIEKPYKSFFSGHTSSAFCSAVFIGTVFSDLYPHSPWRFAVWGASLAAASLTGAMRYYAGKHFPSDILVGAAVGSLFGYIVPYLHRKSIWRDASVSMAILPEVSTHYVGMQVVLGI